MKRISHTLPCREIGELVPPSVGLFVPGAIVLAVVHACAIDALHQEGSAQDEIDCSQKGEIGGIPPELGDRLGDPVDAGGPGEPEGTGQMDCELGTPETSARLTDVTVDVCTVPPCSPECAGKECGTNGCGGTCGTCTVGSVCTVFGKCCEATCAAGATCGSDKCGGLCGICGPTDVCDAGTCVKHGRECDDGNSNDWDGCSASGLIGPMVVNQLGCADVEMATNCVVGHVEAASTSKDTVVIAWQYFGTNDPGVPMDSLFARTIDPMALDGGVESVLAITNEGAISAVGPISVAALPDGDDALVTWLEMSAELTGCYGWKAQVVSSGLLKGNPLEPYAPECAPPDDMVVLPTQDYMWRVYWRSGETSAVRSFGLTPGAAMSPVADFPTNSPMSCATRHMGGASLANGFVILAWNECFSNENSQFIRVAAFCSHLSLAMELGSLGNYEESLSYHPAVVQSGTAEFVVIHPFQDQLGHTGIMGTGFVASLETGENAFEVYPATAAYLLCPKAIRLGQSGRFLVTWSQRGVLGGDDRILGRTFESPGVPSGSPIVLWSSPFGTDPCGTPVPLSDGGFALVFVGETAQGLPPNQGSGVVGTIYLQRFGPSGQRMWKNCGDGTCSEDEADGTCPKDCGP